MSNGSGVITIGRRELAQPLVQRTLCAATGLRGPLVLSVQTSTQGWPALDSAAGRVSTPLPAATSFRNPWDPDREFFSSYLGSWCLQIDTTLLGRTRSFLADLAAGTYQLPPCDEVRIGVRVEALGGEAAPVGPLTVLGAVEPGSVGPYAATPLVATIVGQWLVPAASEPSVGWYVRLPEACTRWRTGMWGMGPLRGVGERHQGLAVAHAPFAVLGYQGVVDFLSWQRSWQEAPRGSDLVSALWSAQNTDEAEGVSVYPFIQCELCP